MKYIKKCEEFDWEVEHEDEFDDGPDFDSDGMTDHEFGQFLVDNGCYEEYIKYFNEYTKRGGYRGIGKVKDLKDFLTNKGREDYLADSFDWSRTGNGQFWSNLSGEWRKIVM